MSLYDSMIDRTKDRLDDCQQHELVGRFLQRRDGKELLGAAERHRLTPRWSDLLRQAAGESSAERLVRFVDLSGQPAWWADRCRMIYGIEVGARARLSFGVGCFGAPRSHIE